MHALHSSDVRLVSTECEDLLFFIFSLISWSDVQGQNRIYKRKERRNSTAKFLGQWAGLRRVREALFYKGEIDKRNVLKQLNDQSPCSWGIFWNYIFFLGGVVCYWLQVMTRIRWVIQSTLERKWKYHQVEKVVCLCTIYSQLSCINMYYH